MHGRLVLLLIVALCSLSACHVRPAQPTAIAGLLDLREYNFASSDPVPLVGQWQFRWKSFESGDVQIAPPFAQVPGVWTGMDLDGRKLPATGYATYRLRILLPPEPPPLAVYANHTSSAYRLYVDGELTVTDGTTASDARSGVPGRTSLIREFRPRGDTLELVLWVSNFDYYKGGPWKASFLGTPRALQRMRTVRIMLQIGLVGSIFVIGFYHLMVFALRPVETAELYFGLTCLCTALHALALSGELVLFPGHRLSWGFGRLLEGMTAYLSVPLTLAYVNRLFRGILPRTLFRIGIVTGAFFVGTILTLDTAWIFWWRFYLAASVGAVVLIAYIAVRRRRAGARIFVAAALGLSAAITNDLLHDSEVIRTANLAPAGLFAFLLAQSYMLARNSAAAYQRSRRLTNTLRTSLSRERRLQADHDRLVEVDRFKTEFFANISHEFRTPLTLILAPVEELLLKTTDSDQRRQFRVIRRSALRLLSLINNLLELARIEESHVRIQRTPQDVAGLTKAIAASFEDVAHARQSSLSLRGTDRALPVLIDRERYEIVLINLLGNALKFGAGNPVRITLNRRAGGLTLAVRDGGPGISPADAPKIFQRFARGTDEQLSGTGIGLALARAVAELQNGTLDFLSRPGRGSVFRLRLPALSTQLHNSDEGAPLATTAHWATTGAVAQLEATTPVPDPAAYCENQVEINRILVVEDEADMRSYLMDLLSGEYLVEAVANVTEAVAALERDRPKAIVCDLMLGLVDGMQLLDRVRESDGPTRIPFLFLTAKAERDSRLEALEKGADDFLPKPFSPDELRLRLRNLVHRDASSDARVEAERETIFADLHDRLGANLADLRTGIERLIEAPTGYRAQLQHLRTLTEAVSTGLRRRLQAIEDRQYSKADPLGGLKLQLLRRYREASRSLKFVSDSDTEDLFTEAIPPRHYDDLTAIVTELCSNDLKYGTGPSHWSFAATPQGPTLSLESRTRRDPSASSPAGFGRKTLRRRALEMGGTLEESKTADGTYIFRLRLPVDWQQDAQGDVSSPE